MIFRWLATLPSFTGNSSTLCAAAPRRPENEQEYHLAGIEYQMRVKSPEVDAPIVVKLFLVS